MSYVNVNIDGVVGMVDKYITTNGTNILNISLATNKPHKTPQGDYEFIATWHKVKVIGKQADYLIKKELDKGDNLIMLNAEIENSSYEKNGSKQFVTKIVSDFSTEFLVRKKRNTNPVEQSDINPKDMNYAEIDSIGDDDDILF